MTRNILMPYGISLAGFKPALITRPLVHQIPMVKTILLFFTDHEKSLATRDAVKASLPSFGITLHEHKIINIYDFFEVYFAVEYLTQIHGLPLWINTTAGPGLAVSALSTFALRHNVNLIAYDETKDWARLISTEKLSLLQKCREKYFTTLRAIRMDTCTLKVLTEQLSISNATLSRQLKIFKELDLIEISGSGNGYFPYNVKLTEWGKKFSFYSDSSSD